jgi:iron-regulated transporter 1
MQDYIPADVRGLVGGVQQSLNALFGLLSFALGIFLPDPKDFYIYVAAGYASVGLAVICFTFGVYLRRDKLGPHAIDT